ncbi:sensor histidine kinase [Brevundimonas sp.]|uniref:sensor histidine kinase n=1 Tax=Brevundimonas sp. TaxID=1871086 RepID=UPI0025EEFB58|nr:sensor histidine kinase [Brevundimonas sp.]
MLAWRKLRLGAGVQGIRFRLGVALGLALAPILVLSALQSRTAYDNEVERTRTELVRAARASAADAQMRIDGAVIMLRTLRPETIGLYCVPRLRQLVQDLEAYDALVHLGRNGRVTCASGDVRAADALINQPWFQRIRNGESLVISRAPDGVFSENPALLAAIRSERPMGAFDGVFLAVMPLEDVTPQRPVGVTLEDSQVALVDANGIILTATDRQAFPEGRVPQTSLRSELTDIVDARGDRRIVTASPFADGDVQVVLSIPSQGLVAWAVGNAAGVFYLPLLTWCLALLFVLVVTERVVVRWLLYLERIAAIYAKGRFNVRPVQARHGPAEIRSLGRTLDHMVDTIVARDASLRESLDEKDRLMREIHHRVKNNLQVITSLLNMQQRALKDPAARLAMNDTRQRITALALIYRALYQSENLKRVDVGQFLEDLVGQLIAQDSGRGPAVETRVEADALVVDPDKLAPIALWAVEAISNAQKHAFAGRGGLLQVRFRRGEEDSVLEVEDDGPGPVDGQGGVGQTLMTAFARQLRGRAEILSGEAGGVLARLTFPSPEIEAPEPTAGAEADRNQGAA